MNFDLIRPCANCPFRTDIDGYLRGERAQEIARSLARGASFPCHKTTVAVEDEDEEELGGLTEGPKSQMCAGALLVLEAEDYPNQMMRIAERLGQYDPTKLDRKAPVAGSLEEFIRHHAGEEVDVPVCSACEENCLAPAGYMEGGVAVRNVEVDPEDLVECLGCGEPVCTECVHDSGFCPYCDEDVEEDDAA